MKKDIVIFLDFDGVLHYFFPRKDISDEDNAYFAFLPLFENTIRELQKECNFKIVISSSWRESRTLQELKSMFSNDIAELIVGKNGYVAEVNKFSRELESIEWLKDNDNNDKWIAIDDNPDIWRSHEKLVLCEERFDDESANELKKMCLA